MSVSRVVPQCAGDGLTRKSNTLAAVHAAGVDDTPYVRAGRVPQACRPWSGSGCGGELRRHRCLQSCNGRREPTTKKNTSKDDAAKQQVVKKIEGYIGRGNFKQVVNVM